MIFKLNKDIIHCSDSYYEQYNTGVYSSFVQDKYDNYYYKGYLLHREGMPAIEYDDKTKMWFLNGKRHRINGPAIEWNNGAKEWWLNGKWCRKEEYWKIINLKIKTRVLNEI